MGRSHPQRVQGQRSRIHEKGCLHRHQGHDLTGNSAVEAGGAIYNTIGSELQFSGTNTFSGNTVNGKANDIHNDGTIKVVDGTLSLDGGITGNGTMEMAAGSALTVKVGASQEQSTTIANAVTLGDGVTLNLIFSTGFDGEYKLADTVNGTFTLGEENALFDITAVDGKNGSFTVAKKSVEDIVESTGGDANQGSALDALISADASESKNETFKEIAESITTAVQSADPVQKRPRLTPLPAMSADAAPVVHQVQTDTGVQIFSAVGSRLSGGVQGMASGDVLSESAIWVQTMAGRTDMDDTSKAKGYDADSYGFAFGGEAKVFDVAKVGVGFAYNNTDVDGFLRQTDVDGYTAFVYGEYKPSNWFVNGIMSYTWADYEETKSVLGTSVRADYDVETFGIQAMTGCEIKLAQFFVMPEVGMRYFHISQDSYTDTAAHEGRQHERRRSHGRHRRSYRYGLRSHAHDDDPSGIQSCHDVRRRSGRQQFLRDARQRRKLYGQRRNARQLRH